MNARFGNVLTAMVTPFKKGQIEWHSLLTVVAILGICLVVAVQLSAWQIRKRVAAGIVRFRQAQRPVDTVERLQRLKTDYLYVGWTFESMLEPFAQARNRGGMAQKTALRLLLADPEDPQQVDHCIQNLSGNLTPEAFRKDLCQRLLKTLAALDGFGRVAIRLHTGPFKGWAHLFDGEAMVFGMMPRGSDGLAAPAMELEPVPGRWTLFDHLSDWANESWGRGKEIKDVEQWKQRLTKLAS